MLLLLLLAASLASAALVPQAQAQTGSTPYGRELQSELQSRSFNTMRLCQRPAGGAEFVEIVARDRYTLPLPAGGSVLMNLSTTFQVVSCNKFLGAPVAYGFLAPSFESSINWTPICEETLNLTVRVRLVASGRNSSFRVRPCNYTQVHAGVQLLALQQWLLLTYNASWQPQWLSRNSTARAPGAATVELLSCSDGGSSARWSSVVLRQPQLAAWSPAQQAAASLTTVDTRSWGVACRLMNCSSSPLLLRFNDSSGGGGGGLAPLSVQCLSATPDLYAGKFHAVPRADSSVAAASAGSWGDAARRAVLAADFGAMRLCFSFASTAWRIILHHTVVLSTVQVPHQLYLSVEACDGSVNSSEAQAIAKTQLLRAANWTEVCDNVAWLEVMFENPTTWMYPCSFPPTFEASAWALLSSSIPADFPLSRVPGASANTATLEIGEWRATPRVRWRRLRADAAGGDQVQRLLTALAAISASMWPAFCDLANVTNSLLAINVTSNDNSSIAVLRFVNCSQPTQLLTSAATTTTTTPTTATSTNTTTATTTPTTTSSTNTTTATTTPTTTASTTTTSTTTTSSTTTSSTTTSSTTTPAPTTARNTTTQTTTTTEAEVPLSERHEVATQTIIVVAALTLLAVFCAVGVCRLVLPPGADWCGV